MKPLAYVTALLALGFFAFQLYGTGQDEPKAVSTQSQGREDQSEARQLDLPPERVAPAHPEKRLTDDEASPVEELEEDDCGLAEGPHDPRVHVADPPEDEHGKVTFAIHFKDEVSPYRLISTALLPGETLPFEVVLTSGTDTFTARTSAGTLETLGAESWSWTAPNEPGVHCIEIEETSSGQVLCLQIFVQRPYRGEAELAGYRIGAYQEIPLRGNPAYDRPDGLIEVSPEDHDRWVSPHFQLRQFLCKQDDGPPRFLDLSTRLLLKLELLLEEVNRRGYEADSFFVMSGYRTPFYNAAIGNRTTYSRHAYGDAADIFIDQDRDGRMDDLNADGRVTIADAEVLHNLVEELYGSTWYTPFVGGLGLYGPAPHRGPFIHVDTRGHRARW